MHPDEDYRDRTVNMAATRSSIQSNRLNTIRLQGTADHPSTSTLNGLTTSQIKRASSCLLKKRAASKSPTPTAKKARKTSVVGKGTRKRSAVDKNARKHSVAGIDARKQSIVDNGDSRPAWTTLRPMPTSRRKSSSFPPARLASCRPASPSAHLSSVTNTRPPDFARGIPHQAATIASTPSAP